MFLREPREIRRSARNRPPPPLGDRKSIKISFKNQLRFSSIFSSLWGAIWRPILCKFRPKIEKNRLRNHTRYPKRFRHRIFMDLAPHGTSKIAFPPRREAHFRYFALLLLVPFFHPFWGPFSNGFSSIFNDFSHPKG